MSQADTQTKKPIKEFRATGRGAVITAAVWENEIKRGTETVITRSVTFQKRYCDSSEKWHDSSSFYRDEIPALILVAQQAYEFIATGKDTDDEEKRDDIPI